VPSLPVQTALRVRTPDPHCWLHSEYSLSTHAKVGQAASPQLLTDSGRVPAQRDSSLPTEPSEPAQVTARVDTPPPHETLHWP